MTSDDDEGADDAATSAGLSTGDVTELLPPAPAATAPSAWSVDEADTDEVIDSDDDHSVHPWYLVGGAAAAVFVICALVAIIIEVMGTTPDVPKIATEPRTTSAPWTARDVPAAAPTAVLPSTATATAPVVTITMTPPAVTATAAPSAAPVTSVAPPAAAGPHSPNPDAPAWEFSHDSNPALAQRVCEYLSASPNNHAGGASVDIVQPATGWDWGRAFDFAARAGHDVCPQYDQ